MIVKVHLGHQNRRGSIFFGVGIFGTPGAAPLVRVGVAGDPRALLVVETELRLRSRSLPAFLGFAIPAGGGPMIRDSVQGSSNSAFCATDTYRPISRCRVG